MAFFSFYLPFCFCLQDHAMYICFNVRLNPCVLGSWGNFFLIEWNILFSPLFHFAFPALWPPGHRGTQAAAMCTDSCMRELRNALQHKLISLLNTLWDLGGFLRSIFLSIVAPLPGPQHVFYRQQLCCNAQRLDTRRRETKKSRVSIPCETWVCQKSLKS